MASRRDSARTVFVLVVYLLLAVAMTHPLWLRLDQAVPSDIGDPLLNAWTLAWDAHALLSDPRHLFDANIFHPLPNTLAYSEHLLASAMLLLPIQAATGEPVATYNSGLLLSFALSGFGMYLLCRRWTGRRSVAFLAGLAFAFAPYRLAAIAHLQLLTVQWLPFSILALDWLLEGKTRVPPDFKPEGGGSHKRAAGLFVLFTALQMLSSWYLAVFTAWVSAVYAVIWLAGTRRPWREVSRRLACLAACAGATAVIVWPVAYRYLEVLPQLEAARPVEMARALAAQPGDFLAAAPFLRLPGPLTGAFRDRPGFTEENNLYPGIITSLLALMAVGLACRGILPEKGRQSGRRWRVAALAVILVVSLALTLEVPYLALIRLAPALRVVRAPARYMIPATFALAGLTAYASAWLQARLSRQPAAGRLRQWAPAAVSALIGLYLLAESFAVPLPLARVGSTRDLAPVYRALRQLTLTTPQPPGAVVELPMHVAPAPEYPETRRMLASRLGWWGLVNGYSGFTPPRQLTLGQRLAGFPSLEATAALRDLAASGVRYLVVHPDEPPFDRWRWQSGDRFTVERGTTLAPLGDFGADALYAINPYGDRLITDVQSVSDAYWTAHAPLPLGCYFVAGSVRVRLAAYRLEPALSATEPGAPSRDTLRLTLYWQAAGRLDEDYTVFVHSLDEAGHLTGQADGPPVANRYPTTAWQPAEIVQDSRLAPIGRSVLLGLTESTGGQRLPVFGADGTRLADDAVRIEAERLLAE